MIEIEKGAADEKYTILKWHLVIRIHELIDYISSTNVGVGLKSTRTSVKDVLKLNTSHEIKMEVVHLMEKYRKCQPIMVACIQNEYWVIDGNHRLKRRELDGDAECDVIYIPNELLFQFSQPLIENKTKRGLKKQMDELKEVLEVHT